MTILPTSPNPKWWGNSLTIQGALLSAASAMLPAAGAMLGLDLNGDAVRQIGEQTVTIVQAVGGLAGMVMTVAGRMRATQPLIRRDLRVKF
jgi:hypothetical protein